MKKMLLLLMFPVAAHAQFWSGNTLLQKLNSTDTVDKAVALGYVIGVSDSNQNSVHCSGPNVTGAQTRDVVQKFLTQNPSVRDENADLLVAVALGQAWPCKNKSNKQGGV
jgi:hypothetical protein